MSYYEVHKLENCELPFVFNEVLDLRSRVLLIAPHWHENVEVLHIVDGHGIITNNGNKLHVSAGDIVVVNRNHLHTSATADGLFRFRYLIIDPSFCVANRFDTSRILFDMLIRDKRAEAALEELNAAYQTAEDDPYRALQIRAAVLNVMYILCKHHSQPETSPEGQVAIHIKKAIEYIRASYDKDFSLEDVANFAGMHKCYISREIHRYTGHSFVEYVGKTRCIRACQLLLDDQLSILEIGRKCGFHNMSYFAKCFKKHTGMLPSEYRKSKTAPPTAKFVLPHKTKQ